MKLQETTNPREVNNLVFFIHCITIENCPSVAASFSQVFFLESQTKENSRHEIGGGIGVGVGIGVPTSVAEDEKNLADYMCFGVFCVCVSACARVRECVCLSAWVSVLNLFLETHTCAHTHSHMPELSRLWRYNGTLAYSQTNALRLVFSLSLLSWAREC